MPDLTGHLKLPRCPHCGIDRPNITEKNSSITSDFEGYNTRYWKTYYCHRCGGVILASSPDAEGAINAMYPEERILDDSIPQRAREYLEQAMDSKHAPSGAVILASSAVDAMLKAKGYKEGKLYPRIDKAAAEHVITKEMALWAHEVRLDANVERHADENGPLPSKEDAQRSIDFVVALSQFIFVLPSRIVKGREEATSDKSESTSQNGEG